MQQAKKWHRSLHAHLLLRRKTSKQQRWSSSITVRCHPTVVNSRRSGRKGHASYRTHVAAGCDFHIVNKRWERRQVKSILIQNDDVLSLSAAAAGAATIVPGHSNSNSYQEDIQIENVIFEPFALFEKFKFITHLYNSVSVGVRLIIRVWEDPYAIMVSDTL